MLKRGKEFLRCTKELGNLLVRSLVEYEEHWRKGARSEMSGGKFESLTYPYVDVQLGIVKIALNLRSRQTKLARCLASGDGTTFKRIAYSRGAYSGFGYQVDLAEGGCRLALLPNLRRPVPWPAG